MKISIKNLTKACAALSHSDNKISVYKAKQALVFPVRLVRKENIKVKLCNSIGDSKNETVNNVFPWFQAKVEKAVLAHRNIWAARLQILQTCMSTALTSITRIRIELGAEF